MIIKDYLSRRRVVSEKNGALLLARLDDVGLLPVLHDVGEGELEMLVHRLAGNHSFNYRVGFIQSGNVLNGKE